MTKMLSLAVVIVMLSASFAFAHHPAEDIVDEEIYTMIDAMVADTPHADLVFEDDMGAMTTTISVDSVGAADVLIRDGLLDNVSLLNGDVSISVEFLEDLETAQEFEALSLDSEQRNGLQRKWSEWGRPVVITIIQVYE